MENVCDFDSFELSTLMCGRKTRNRLTFADLCTFKTYPWVLKTLTYVKCGLFIAIDNNSYIDFKTGDI